MDVILAKIFATALVFSQITTAPAELKTNFDEIHDRTAVNELLRSGCAHMRKAFDVEDLDLDDLIATAMEDVEALTANQAVMRGINVKTLHVAYRQFCKNEDVEDASIDLADIIRFYNATLADLPSSIDLTELKPPGMSSVLDATGAPYQQRRSWTPLAQIPLIVQQAFVAAEDKRFYEHKGVDERALIRAFIANFARPGRLQGGSTISQQVVKTLLVGGEVAYERKMREMVLASRLERSVGKSRILELYLNSIYLGRGAWGVEMASQSYFGKPVASLDVTEAAVLAGLAKGPTFYSPERHVERSVSRTSYVLNRLYEDGVIDESVLKSSVESLPAQLVGYEGVPRGSYFADYLAREGKSVAKVDIFGGDPYTVRSTIHPQLQQAAEAALQEGLSRYERNAGRADFQQAEINLADAVAKAVADLEADGSKPAWQIALASARLPVSDIHWPAAVVMESDKRGKVLKVGLVDGSVLPLSLGRTSSSKLKLYDVVRVRVIESKGKPVRAELRVRPTAQGAVVVLENKSGRVLAMAGGFSYSVSQLNRATQSQRQPGSSIKPLVYLAALQRGVQPNTLVRDEAVSYPPIGGTQRARPEDFWTPKNYDGSEGGIITIRQALESSKNLATARLLDGIEATPPQSLDHLCRLAQHLKLYKDCIRYYPFVLGAQPVRLIDMAAFYATIANEGARPTPYSIETISRDDQTAYQNEDVPEEVTLADKAAFYQLKVMMQGILARGTAGSISHLAPYVAGKTGTTDGENDAWFVGFSNEVTVAVWVGYDNADGRRTLGSGRTGGNVAIPIFEPVMQAVWSHYAPKTALRPASVEARRNLVVSRNEQKSTKSRSANLLPEYFRRDDRGRAVDAQYRLLTRKDREAHAAAQAAKRRPREAEQAPEPRHDPWSSGHGWFGGQQWSDDRNDNRGRSGRGFW
jgi:membrane carboxypeptidase/penicillin-binding protein